VSDMSDRRLLAAVIVTWMDGKKETYPATRYLIEDGVLLVADVSPGRQLRDSWYIPLANIRVWKPAFSDADPG